MLIDRTFGTSHATRDAVRLGVRRPETPRCAVIFNMTTVPSKDGFMELDGITMELTPLFLALPFQHELYIIYLESAHNMKENAFKHRLQD